MAILTLAEYKTRRQITEASEERDAALDAALASAEDAVLQYTGRDFTTAQVIETKTYIYDGSGILETDDFVELESVSVSDDALTSQNYAAGPREGHTYYWLDFTGVPRQSPAMGFTRNLDRAYDGYCAPRSYTTVAVKAKFGWPGGAPASVKQAVTFLVDEFVKEQGTAGDIQAEAISDLSYVYQRDTEGVAALPPRVQLLLDPYRRIAL
jgi:hypothetical protein